MTPDFMKSRLRWMGDSYRLYLRDTSILQQKHVEALIKDSNEIQRLLGRNPSYNANFTTDYLQASPENHKKFQRYDPNLSQVNTPSSESFNSEVTSTSTPAVQRKYFGKTEPMPIPSPTRRPEHHMHPGAIPKQTGTRTRGQDPSPPPPGGNTKTIRDMAPNRQPLFHYRFYDPKSKTPPDFTKLQLSAAQVKEYLRGLTDTRDCSNEGYVKAIAYGIENYHAITLHSLEEETFRVITIEDRKIPRDKAKEITKECVYIPEYAMEDFDNLLQAVYLEVLQPMQYDQGYKGNLLLLRAATADWKAKATIHTTETEIISFADKLADIVWMRYFLECQGYTIDEYIVVIGHSI